MSTSLRLSKSKDKPTVHSCLLWILLAIHQDITHGHPPATNTNTIFNFLLFIGSPAPLMKRIDTSSPCESNWIGDRGLGTRFFVVTRRFDQKSSKIDPLREKILPLFWYFYDPVRDDSSQFSAWILHLWSWFSYFWDPARDSIAVFIALWVVCTQVSNPRPTQKNTDL